MPHDREPRPVLQVRAERYVPAGGDRPCQVGYGLLLSSTFRNFISLAAGS